MHRVGVLIQFSFVFWNVNVFHFSFLGVTTRTFLTICMNVPKRSMSACERSMNVFDRLRVWSSRFKNLSNTVYKLYKYFRESKILIPVPGYKNRNGVAYFFNLITKMPIRVQFLVENPQDLICTNSRFLVNTGLVKNIPGVGITRQSDGKFKPKVN